MSKKYEVPKGVKSTPCKGCGAPIFWIKTEREKFMPLDPDGTPHWNTCPNKNQFKKDKNPPTEGMTVKTVLEFFESKSPDCWVEVDGKPLTFDRIGLEYPANTEKRNDPKRNWEQPIIDF